MLVDRMNPIPLISVVMPSYNSEKYIKEAIDSILRQTCADFELIIVDGNSTDNTLAILDEYQKLDTRIKVIQDEGRGIGAALQLGCKVARGEFIARMDSDDIAVENRFEKQLRVFKSNSNVVLVSGTVIYINEKNDIIGYSFPYTCKQIVRERLFLIAHPTVMMRRNAYLRAGGYQALLRAEDYFLWEKIKKEGELFIMNEALVQYRWLSDSLSHTLSAEFNKKLKRKMATYIEKPFITELDITDINTFIKFHFSACSTTSLMAYRKTVDTFLFRFLSIFIPVNINIKVVIFFKNIYGRFRF